MIRTKKTIFTCSYMHALKFWRTKVGNALLMAVI
jgi:hypothetical protein